MSKKNEVLGNEQKESTCCNCKICNSTYNTVPFKDSYICEDCVTFVKSES